MVLEYRLDEEFTPRDLTREEKAFLNALAGYIMFLDKSLFFQIKDLQRHTKLLLSRNDGRITHSEFPNRDKLEKEIAELSKMLDDLRKEQGQEHLPEENWNLLKIWERQREKLKDALDNPASMVPTPSLGAYFNRGKESLVVLFVDAIEEEAKKDPYNTMLLMGQVLLHEYFHSFHFHVGVGVRDPMKCVEEPMAEYGSLVLLDRVASSGLPIAKDAEQALKYALGFVKSKQQCTGLTAAYGFGAYLYEKHKEDSSSLISQYANVSRMMDNCCKEALEYKYLLYPTYPPYPWAENAAYKTLEEFLKLVVVREPNCTRFVRKVFEFLRDNELLDCLEPFIRDPREVKTRKLFSLSKDGCFCLRGILYVDSNPPSILSHGPFVIGGESYYLKFIEWDDKSKTPRHPRRIDEFAKMIACVYHGRFDIRETGDEYIMSHNIN